jgi:hypothetical protein
MDEVAELMDCLSADVEAVQNQKWETVFDRKFYELDSREKEEVVMAMRAYEAKFCSGVDGEVNQHLAFFEAMRILNEDRAAQQTRDLACKTGGGQADAQKIQHEEMERVEKEALDGRVKQVISKVVLKGATKEVEDGKLLDFLSSFGAIVEDLLEKYVKTGAKTNDKAQMVLQAAGMEHPISTPVRLVSDLTVNHLLAAVEAAQTSGLTIKFSDSIQIHFTHIRCDAEWEDADDPMIGGRGGWKHLLYFSHI